MSATGTCDLCNGSIEKGEGYVFYSATVPPGQSTETGLMHLCNGCTEKYMNEQYFQKVMKVPSIQVEDFVRDFARALQWLQEANALGAIALCKAHGLTAEQAKAQARKFATLFWENKERCIREATAFWTSARDKIQTTQPESQQPVQSPTQGGCFIASACYGNSCHEMVQLLTAFRDDVLHQSSSGRKLIELYYRFSPSIAVTVHQPTRN